MLVGSLFIWVIYFLPWRFQVNDDVIMMWLVSGSYTGTPESYAVFIHPLLSTLLSYLYQLNFQVQWYAVYTFCTLWISFLVGTLSINQSKLSVPGRAVLKTIFLIITLHFCLFPQFTLVAGWSALNGLVYLQVQPRAPWKKQLPGFLLFILSTFIRAEASGLILLGTGVFNYAIHQRKAIPKIFICGILILLSLKSQKIWEANSTYKEYLSFNHARHLVVDHPVFYQKVQNETIDQNSKWYFFSQRIIDGNTHSLEEINEFVKELNLDYWKPEYAFQSVIRLKNVFQAELFKSFVSAILLLLFFHSFKGNRSVLMGLAAWLVFLFAFNHFYLIRGRVVFLFFLPLLVILLEQPASVSPLKFTKMLIGVLCMFFGLHLLNLLKEAEKRNNYLGQFESLVSKKEDYPIQLEGFPIEYFSKYYSPSQPVPFIIGGWLSKSPFEEEARARLGFKDLESIEKYLLIGIQENGKLVFPEFMRSIQGPSTLVRMEKTEDLILFEYKK